VMERVRGVHAKYRAVVAPGETVPLEWAAGSRAHRAAFEAFFHGWKAQPPSLAAPHRKQLASLQLDSAPKKGAKGAARRAPPPATTCGDDLALFAAAPHDAQGLATASPSDASPPAFAYAPPAPGSWPEHSLGQRELAAYGGGAQYDACALMHSMAALQHIYQERMQALQLMQLAGYAPIGGAQMLAPNHAPQARPSLLMAPRAAAWRTADVCCRAGPQSRLVCVLAVPAALRHAAVPPRARSRSAAHDAAAARVCGAARQFAAARRLLQRQRQCQQHRGAARGARAAAAAARARRPPPTHLRVHRQEYWQPPHRHVPRLAPLSAARAL